jgi:hypothetical protein
MEREGLFVELRRLDGPGGALDAEADEGRGGDGPGAHGAGLAVDISAVFEHRRAAVPMAMEG